MNARKTGFTIALVWLAGLASAAAVAPFFLKGQAAFMDLRHVLEAPSALHWLGTDSLGRDVFARILCGGGVSLSVGILSVAVSLAVGIFIGAAAGYFGGWADRLLMGFVDTMLCFPTFFLILAVIAILGPSVVNIFLIIGFTSWMGTARLVRAEVLTLREREFVLAARALGAAPFDILTRHLVPNALAPVIVNGVLGVSAAILTETGLSFLGIGVQPPTPSWGNLLTDGKATLGVAWWLTLFPGLMILLTVLAVNVIGERLQKR